MAKPNSTDYWEIVARLLAQYPTLSTQNVSAYTYLYPNISSPDTGKEAGSLEAIFALPDPTSPTELQDLLKSLVADINTTYTGKVSVQAEPATFPDLYSLFLAFADTTGAGVDKVVGSRLLPAESLTGDAFNDALKTFLGSSGGRLYMVAGAGVREAKPRGGSDAVNPAWRNALIHAGMFNTNVDIQT